MLRANKSEVLLGKNMNTFSNVLSTKKNLKIKRYSETQETFNNLKNTCNKFINTAEPKPDNNQELTLLKDMYKNTTSTTTSTKNLRELNMKDILNKK